MCSAVELDEADERLAAGWHVDLRSDVNASAQRRRYLKELEGIELPPEVLDRGDGDP